MVCGAPNARAGMKGVFAPAGTVIPRTGAVLKESAIRGVASRGMLCSAYELGLGDDHDGIIELGTDAPIGAKYADLLGLGDAVIDIKVTPNRADCLGVRGIARDLAAAGLGRLKPLDTSPVPGRFRSPIGISIEDRSACPLFLGRHIRGLRNGPSPDWLRRRLEAIGLRPISALVDITNFLTFDLNRPLHVFDAGRLDGDLTVRLAREGETLLALNGQEYALDPEMTVIADQPGCRASAASSAARRPAAPRRRPRCLSRRPCSTRCAPPRPAAGSTSPATRAIASSAGSTRPLSATGSKSRPG